MWKFIKFQIDFLQPSFISKIFSGAKKLVSGITGNAVLGAGASLIGGRLANSARADAAQTVGNFNQATAREQMDFQERMSNTAHQRQIKDLKKANLNPILSAKYGGASIPSGAMGQMPMFDQQDIFTPA